MTATAFWPSTHRAEATLDRSDSASPKKRHKMKAATTTTTATSAPMTPMLTPRRPAWMARWLPVHSPPSHSPACAGRTRGGVGSVVKERAGASVLGLVSGSSGAGTRTRTSGPGSGSGRPRQVLGDLGVRVVVVRVLVVGIELGFVGLETAAIGTGVIAFCVSRFTVTGPRSPARRRRGPPDRAPVRHGGRLGIVGIGNAVPAHP